MCDHDAVAGVRNPKRRGDDGRRAELVRAASRVIAREGIAAATTRRIAEEAGVPPGLVHYWFTGKDELLAAVVAESLEPIEAASGASAVRVDGRPVALFDRLQAAFRSVERDDPGHQIGLYELTTWALRRPELREVARHQYEQYRRLAADAADAWLQETGGRFPGGVDVLAQFVAALFDGLGLAWLADPEGTDVDAVLHLVSELVEGRCLTAR